MVNLEHLIVRLAWVLPRNNSCIVPASEACDAIQDASRLGVRRMRCEGTKVMVERVAEDCPRETGTSGRR